MMHDLIDAAVGVGQQDLGADLMAIAAGVVHQVSCT